MNERSSELLFEVYDVYSGVIDEEPRFLGLCIVSLDEIRRSKQSMHELPLQSRPYYNDAASGSITVEVRPTCSTRRNRAQFSFAGGTSPAPARVERMSSDQVEDELAVRQRPLSFGASLRRSSAHGPSRSIALAATDRRARLVAHQRDDARHVRLAGLCAGCPLCR